MKKRIAILGRGTAGCLSAAHFSRWLKDYEVQWCYDPNTPTKAVGEGTTLIVPEAIYHSLDFSYTDLSKVDGTFKRGIFKSGWGEKGTEFFHNFQPPKVGYHFNALALQDFTLKRLEKKVTIVEGRFTPNEIDADHVVDCSGKPTTFDDYISVDVPVNSVYVSHCAWEYPRFDYTLTLARPWGWVFGIPLRNRCAVGYLYNRHISTLEQVKEDSDVVLASYGLTRTRDVQFDFDSYVAKQNFNERVSLNGDKSFFLEPLEATSTGVIDHINRSVFDLLTKRSSLEKENNAYTRRLHEIYGMIMLHYFSGSVYKNKFWHISREKATEVIRELIAIDPKFVNILSTVTSEEPTLSELCDVADPASVQYGGWWLGSFLENINGFGIKDNIKLMLQRGSHVLV